MKKKLIVLAMVLGLLVSGCACSNLTKIQNQFGPPTKVELTCDQTIWYYYWFDIGFGGDPIRQTRYITVDGANVAAGDTNNYVGWLCWRIVADKNGNVITHSKYFVR